VPPPLNILLMACNERPLTMPRPMPATGVTPIALQVCSATHTPCTVNMPKNDVVQQFFTALTASAVHIAAAFRSAVAFKAAVPATGAPAPGADHAPVAGLYVWYG